MKKSLFRNYRYIFKRLFHKNKRLAVYSVLMILVSFVPILDVVFPKFLFAALIETPISLKKVILVICVFFGFSTLMRGSQSFFSKRNNVYLTNLSFTLKEDIHLRALTMDYPNTENPAVLDQIHTSNMCANFAKDIIEKSCDILSSTVILLMDDVGRAIEINPYIDDFRQFVSGETMSHFPMEKEKL